MKNMIAIVVLAISAITAQAQTAKVIELRPEDAAKAQDLYRQRGEIDRQIDELKAKIEEHYMSAPVSPDIYDTHCKGADRVIVVDGSLKRSCIATDWMDGFEYSDDFRFVVPKATPPLAKSPFLGGTVLTDGSLIPFAVGSASAVGQTNATPDLFYHELEKAPVLVGHAVDPVQEMSDAIKTCTAHIDETVHIHDMDFEPLTATCRDVQKETCMVIPSSPLCSVAAE